jgi:hypothetical protein
MALNMHPGWCKGCNAKVESQHGALLRDAKGWYVDCSVGGASPSKLPPASKGPADRQAQPGPRQVAGAAAAAFAAWVATFIPSPRQLAVAEVLRSTEKHIIIQAVAGSGKSSLLRYLVSLLASIGLTLAQVAALAFGRKIARELRSKLPESLSTVTCHAAGKGLLMGSRTDNRRVEEPNSHLAADVYARLWPGTREDAGAVGMSGLGTADLERNARLQSAVVKLCDAARLTLTDPTDAAALAGIVERYTMDLPGGADDAEVYARTAKLVAQLTREWTEQALMDFTGMLYLPYVLDLRPKSVRKLLLGDEIQDWNAAQRALNLRLAGFIVKPDGSMDEQPGAGRIIGVGDEHQSIMGFAYADTQAIESLRTMLASTSRGCVEMPLDVCWRCPQDHIDLVHEIGLHDSILARPGAPKGTLLRFTSEAEIDGWFGGLDKRSEALIVCRTNAPLVGRAFSLIRRKVACKIEGRDLASDLQGMVKRIRYKSDGNDLDAFLRRLGVWVDREARKLCIAKREMAAEQLADKAATLVALSEGCEGVSDMLAWIEKVFEDSDDGRSAPIVFSSIHRCKGLQCETVVILEPQLLPHPMARQAWEWEQEEHLAYVALTRSTDRLVICGRLGFEGDGGYDGPDGEDSEAQEPQSVHSAFEGLGRVSLPARSAHACADVSEDEHEAALAAFQAAADADDEHESLGYFQARPLPSEAPAEPATTHTLWPVPGAPVVHLPTPTAIGDGAYVGCTREEWDTLADAYLDAGCEAWLEVPERWHQWAMVVRRAGVTVRCSTTLDVTGGGGSRVKGANAIDIVCVGRVGPATRVLRTAGWLGRVARKVNEMLEREAC